MAGELQKDPVSRGQFLLLGGLGALVGAVLTIPPAVYLLDPAIDSVLRGRSDVPDVWRPVGSVFEVPGGGVRVYRVEFPQRQTYDGGGELLGEGSITNAVLVSWRDGELPPLLEGRERGPLSPGEIRELSRRLNVLSNHCTHLGCPVRYFPGRNEILCPCHGGIYDINGGYVGGPPPRGLYRYEFEIRRDGGIYVRHEFEGGKPYVV
ncbi:MAG: Rieske 2Fe-2S domain-containing protein [Rubrobacter sp.]|nr:Rieske 2Fe-2S domain-containing protein [Rubrobacter sp.]